MPKNLINDFKKDRKSLISTLFQTGIPKLWVPLLTHYTKNGDIDPVRMIAHLEFIAPHVKGFLIPGSTSDAWEMSDTEVINLLNFILPHIKRLQLTLLVGALKPTVKEMHTLIEKVLDLIVTQSGTNQLTAAFQQLRICGFTMTAPHGANLSEQQIEQELTSLLALNLPIALYQLPQITKNTLSPRLLATFANQFPNFILFKDSSGEDAIAKSKVIDQKIFCLRGAESDYADWIRENGGPYDGFLLSTANVFPQPLIQIFRAIENKNLTHANELSLQLSKAVTAVFDLVQSLPDGNAFTNANKAIDHFMAYGPQALKAPPPRLHTGSYLPTPVLETTQKILTTNRLMPTTGYVKEV